MGGALFYALVLVVYGLYAMVGGKIKIFGIEILDINARAVGFGIFLLGFLVSLLLIISAS